MNAGKKLFYTTRLDEFLQARGAVLAIRALAGGATAFLVPGRKNGCL